MKQRIPSYRMPLPCGHCIKPDPEAASSLPRPGYRVFHGLGSNSRVAVSALHCPHGCHRLLSIVPMFSVSTAQGLRIVQPSIPLPLPLSALWALLGQAYMVWKGGEGG